MKKQKLYKKIKKQGEQNWIKSESEHIKLGFDVKNIIKEYYYINNKSIKKKVPSPGIEPGLFRPQRKVLTTIR